VSCIQRSTRQSPTTCASALSNVVKFHEGTAVRYRGETLAVDPLGRTADEAAVLARLDLTGEIVARISKRSMRCSGKSRDAPPQPLFRDLSEQRLLDLKMKGQSATGRELPDLRLYFALLLIEPNPNTIRSTVNPLARLRSTETVYPTAHTARRGHTASHDDRFDGQGYLRAAPRGIDVDFSGCSRAGSGLPRLSPAAMRSLLTTTGTQQTAGPRIGTQPNLKAALRSTLPDRAGAGRVTVPAQAAPGQSFSGTVRFVNAGPFDWTAATHTIRCQWLPQGLEPDPAVAAISGTITRGVQAASNITGKMPSTRGAFSLQCFLVSGSNIVGSALAVVLLSSPGTNYDARIESIGLPATMPMGSMAIRQVPCASK